jgi:GTP-binding protein
MKITQAEFVKSALHPADYPRDGRPEIAFVGRSNVGKSSLLNALLSRRGLAKTSSTPGKTQTLNFFSVNGKYYFVDLPGYGFAKVPTKIKNEWGKALTEYLEHRAELRLVVALVDGRHAPSALDEEMLGLLDEAERPVLIVATKVDKLKQAERARVPQNVREGLGLDPEAEVVAVSAEKGTGIKGLWEILDEALERPA